VMCDVLLDDRTALDVRGDAGYGQGLEMAMGTRNPNTRRSLPDMKAGTG
jgi:hypothetical protein